MIRVVVAVAACNLRMVEASFQQTPTSGVCGRSAFYKTRTTKQSSATNLVLHASKDSKDNDEVVFYQYKDDCFGFLSFLCGVAVGDVVFTGVFVALSLAAALGTRQKLLPPDPKRPTIVDRKVPGVVAASTLLLSSPQVKDALVLLGSSNTSFDIPPAAPIAGSIQLGVGVFSIATAFLDIRWRDRFDYPEEFLD